jgi:membrane-bound serine protease (ClpP class)
VVPGALGTVMVLLAIFALNLLPIRFTALLLLLAAFALLMLEAKFGGHGVLAAAGILCLTFGTLTLVEAPIPELSVSPWVAFGVSAAFGLITVFLVRIAVRARRRKTTLGVEALLGHAAIALEPLAPEGHVLVEGEIWRATAAQPVPKGAAVHVVGRSGRLLHVEADTVPDSQ